MYLVLETNKIDIYNNLGNIFDEHQFCTLLISIRKKNIEKIVDFWKILNKIM